MTFFTENVYACDPYCDLEIRSRSTMGHL